MMKRFLFVFILFAGIQLSAQQFSITSPDDQLSIVIDINDTISWSASLYGQVVIQKNQIAVIESGKRELGISAKVKSESRESSKSYVSVPVPHKDSRIEEDYNQLTLEFKGGYSLLFRVFNDGLGYRFIDGFKKSRQVVDEVMNLTFPEGATSFFPQEESMYSHNERLYPKKNLSDLSSDDFCSLPVLFQSNDVNVLFTETALHDYPGMFLKGGNGTLMQTQFPKYVLEAVPAKDSPDRNQDLISKADYIAQLEGEKKLPWRVFVITKEDKDLVESNLTYLMAEPTVINTDWIKPGKVAWDWYNANNVYGVDFKSGLNTATYKYYIDFASKNGIEYVILDEGWTKSTTEILGFNPEMDVPELIAYGKEKGVGIILWVLWKPLDDNLIEILETYKSWGAKGIKVDFMQRNDQYMVASYEKIAKKAAELELLVDYHGAFKPSGLRRKYPNVINYEGVKGSENNKWSADASPEHNVTIPFTRMVAGPMDYTPGAMNNKHEINYNISFERPMSLGTRAHQVAMYTVYEAPLQMLCESPSRYYQEQETVDFITQIPTVWDETLVLAGKVSDYIAVARRNGDAWYIGAMTDWTARSLDLDMNFLGDGTFDVRVFKDGVNADRFAEDFGLEEISVTSDSKLTISMASGGGWSAIITKK
ncbi:MAG: alpha-glucosidase [Flammeovirgaceae bacterium]|nr:alpha-glucosidase [Flammeovirgaceae bacterium]HCX20457.1 alpha-glucosidase [Cytophagales bacterium]|tara:strand:- start:328 stop:2280 length:1953 start_codon:yes stop_codon:yes gene_type:complete